MFETPANVTAAPFAAAAEAGGVWSRTVRRLEVMGELLGRLHVHHAPTVAHSWRVAHVLSAMVAVDPRPMADPTTVAMIGALHDIGKLFVPASVLSSERRLDAAELVAVREHPAAGAAMLQELDFPPIVVAATRDHHERWTGGGYPSARPALEMHPLSRALAVADSFVAMVEPGRAYRQPLSHGQAVAEVVACCGTQFDPAAVALLCSVFHQPSNAVLIFTEE